MSRRNTTKCDTSMDKIYSIENFRHRWRKNYASRIALPLLAEHTCWYKGTILLTPYASRTSFKIRSTLTDC